MSPCPSELCIFLLSKFPFSTPPLREYLPVSKLFIFISSLVVYTHSKCIFSPVNLIYLPLLSLTHSRYSNSSKIIRQNNTYTWSNVMPYKPLTMVCQQLFVSSQFTLAWFPSPIISLKASLCLNKHMLRAILWPFLDLWAHDLEYLWTSLS